MTASSTSSSNRIHSSSCSRRAVVGCVALLAACGRGVEPRSVGREPTSGAPTTRPRAERLVADRAAFVDLIECSRFEWEPLRRALGELRGQASEVWLPLAGWAVLRGELEALQRRGRVLEPDRRERALAAFRHYTAELARAGVELLIVPIPLRLELYAGRLPGVPSRPPPALFTVAQAELFEAAVAQGAEVLPLLATFASHAFVPEDPAGERLYLDYDSHWTPRGAELAADAIAERVRAMKDFVPGSLREGDDFVRAQRRQTFRYPKGEPRDVELAFETITGPTGEPLEARSQESAILLLGDSFANFYREQSADLARLLCARLGQRLDVIGVSGSGGSVWKTLSRREHPLRGKRIVIWAFTSSTIGDESFEPIELVSQALR